MAAFEKEHELILLKQKKMVEKLKAKRAKISLQMHQGHVLYDVNIDTAANQQISHYAETKSKAECELKLPGSE